MRQSLEDAHDALLMRIRDMESVVDSERGQVNDLVSNYDNAKQEAVATREAFDSEHELRVQLEGLVSQQEQDIGKCVSDHFPLLSLPCFGNLSCLWQTS